MYSQRILFHRGVDWSNKPMCGGPQTPRRAPSRPKLLAIAFMAFHLLLYIHCLLPGKYSVVSVSVVQWTEKTTHPRSCLMVSETQNIGFLRCNSDSDAYY